VGDEMDAPEPVSMRQTDVEPFSYTGASTMKISTISIDLAKSVFQLMMFDEQHKREYLKTGISDTHAFK
jgi:hypothetical protein